MFPSLNKLFRLAVACCRKCTSQPKEAALLLRMAWWVSVLAVAARLFPLPRALQIVCGDENSNANNYCPDLPQDLARSIDTVLSADLLCFKPSCWKRAAVLRRFLSHNGITTRIQFGVRNEDIGKVDGHAWLELNGNPFLESALPEYVVTYTYPSDKSYRAEAAVVSSD